MIAHYKIIIATACLVILIACLYGFVHPFIIVHRESPSEFLLKLRSDLEHASNPASIDETILKETAYFENGPLKLHYRLFRFPGKSGGRIVIVPRSFSQGIFVVGQRKAYIFDLSDKSILSLSETDEPKLF